jgi:hypothetical protein
MMMERDLLSDQSRKKKKRKKNQLRTYLFSCVSGMWWFRLSTLGISILFCLAVCDSQSSRPPNRLTESVSSITPQPWRSKNIKKEEEEGKDRNQIRKFCSTAVVFSVLFFVSLYLHIHLFILIISHRNDCRRSFFFYPHARLNSFCATAACPTHTDDEDV